MTHQLCSSEELSAWEGKGKPGSNIIYYQGPSLGRAVSFDTNSKRPTEQTANVVNRVRDLYNLGRIALVQRRLSLGDRTSQFAYVAIFLDKPHDIPSQGRLFPVCPYFEPALA